MKALDRPSTLPGGQATALGAPRRTRGRGLRQDRAVTWLFLLPALIYIALFFGYPIVKNAIMGSQDYTTATFYTGSAPWVGWANYSSFLSSSLAGTTFLNTAVFTVGSIVGQFTIGLAIALFFRRRFPLSGLLRSLLLLPWLLPLIAGAAVWRWILDQDSGVLNSTLLHLHLVHTSVPWLSSPGMALYSVIIVNVWIGIPFNVTLLYSGMQSIPEEQYEAAAIDGAVGWKAFRYITWPGLRPIVTVVLVLGVIYTLKVVDIILGLTDGGPANATQTLATTAYQDSFVRFAFGQGAAVNNILLVVSLLFAGLYLRVNRRASDE
jgi:multiple sugar transport system permease protein